MITYRLKLLSYSLLLTLAGMTKAAAQDRVVIELKQVKSDVSPKSFYIDSLTDGRKDTTNIGSKGKTIPIVLEGGAAALKKYADSNVQQDRSQTAICMRITKMYFTIRKTGDSWITDAAVGFGFYAGGLNLVALADSGHQESTAFSPDFVETFIRQSLDNSLKQFDEWWPEHKNKTPISTTVKVNVMIATTADDAGNIVYRANEPLSIADFRGPYPDDDGPEMAETNSGIGMKTSGSVENGQITLNVVLTPNFIRNGSWFKPDGKNERVLAHEQAHFDITAAKTCELLRTIEHTTFTKEQYERQLQDIYQQTNKDLNAEETQYDAETNHGIITDKQHEWEQKLKEQIAGSGCY